MKVVISGFVNTMQKPQRTAGYAYLPFHIFLIPLFLEMLDQYLPKGLGQTYQYIVYYGLGLAFSLIVMWKYLRTSYDVLADNIIKNIVAFIFAYIIYDLLDYLADALLFIILGDAVITANNTALSSIAGESSNVALGLLWFIAPIIEEILFRGVIFGSLQPKNRTLAYVVSITVFALYSVWEYAVALNDWSMLIYMIEFVPLGYALTWLYEKTNCIWIPIFLHMLINVVMTSLG